MENKPHTMAYKKSILGLPVQRININALLTKAEPKRIQPCSQQVNADLLKTNSLQFLLSTDSKSENLRVDYHPSFQEIWGFRDSSVGKESACNAGDPSLIPGLGRSTE